MFIWWKFCFGQHHTNIILHKTNHECFSTCCHADMLRTDSYVDRQIRCQWHCGRQSWNIYFGAITNVCALFALSPNCIKNVQYVVLSMTRTTRECCHLPFPDRCGSRTNGTCWWRVHKKSRLLHHLKRGYIEFVTTLYVHMYFLNILCLLLPWTWYLLFGIWYWHCRDRWVFQLASAVMISTHSCWILTSCSVAQSHRQCHQIPSQ